MYEAKIITDAGNTVGFGHSWNNVFKIEPLSGVDIDINTSQGFQQIGNTIESLGVGGLSRSISGVYYGNSKNEALSMLQNLPIFTQGKLYIEDKYYCDITVKKTPEVKRKGTFYEFALMVYCRTPFWYSSDVYEYDMGEWQKSFSFPTSYDSHIYATKNASVFIDCYNPGAYKAEPKIVFKADATVTNYGLLNAQTLEYIKLNDSILPGDIVTIEKRNGQLYVERLRSGVTTDIFSTLDEDSDLYWLNVGQNILRMTADTNVSNLVCLVSFSPVYMGVADVV